jgi:hypothetical protein
MHTGPMYDSEGTFSAESEACTSHCRKCDKRTPHKAESWESSCGGYEDYRYTCMVCNTVHWVDGIDS